MENKNLLIIGAGGVGTAVARKCAQHNDTFGDIVIAARRWQPVTEAAAAALPFRRDSARTIQAVEIDARDVAAVAMLMKDNNIGIVINAGSPYINLSVMDACLRAGAHYLDSALYEEENALEVPPPPWYANFEWEKRKAFADCGLTGILSIGFDPGVVNVFSAYARDNWFDEIDSIDIMDVNAGDHGRFFATNFDPETNLREIREEVIYWDEEWRRLLPHSKSAVYDFPEVGERRVFSMGHEELHSLPSFIPAKRIEFWMGFSDRYLRVFTVLEKLGMLSPAPVRIGDAKVSPIKFVKALLPDPKTLAEGYTGKVCIGCLVRGQKAGRQRAVFIYSALSHQAAFQDVGAQAVSYTTAVPLATAALLVARGDWRVGRLVNAEELPPLPFLEVMPVMGIDWNWREEAPDAALSPTRHDENNPPIIV